jgi:acyl-coenzyme A thioesterase PaaI-like protein
MTIWTERLDLIKAGQAERPPAVEIRLPDIVSWRTGQVVAKWEIDEELPTTDGGLSGGYVTALADQVMSHTAMTVLDDDTAFRTVQLNTAFYRPVGKGVLWITGKVKQKNRQAIHTNVDFCDVGGDLMASVTGIQVIVPMRQSSEAVN